MRLPRFQFGLRALLIGVALVALMLWAWPKWQRYRAVRSLNAAIEGGGTVTSAEVKGPPGADRHRLPDYERLKSVTEEVINSEATADAVALLVKRLGSDDVQTRANAAIALGKLGAAAEYAVPALLVTLDDETGVAAPAVYALEQIGDSGKDTVRALTGVLLDQERYPSLRFNAAVALGKIGEFGPILQVIEHEQTQWAPNVFAHIGARSREALPAIAAMLKESDPSLRCAALNALASMAIHVKEALPLVEASKGDEDESVREAAVGALSYIDLVKQNAGRLQ